MIKSQLSSLPFFRNHSTRFVYFFLSPIINIIFLVMLNSEITNEFSQRIVLASLIFSGALLSLNSMISLLVMDLNLHIDSELISKNPASRKYWLTKFVISYLMGILLIGINLIILLIFKFPVPILWQGLLAGLIICVSGTILGFTAFILAWRMRNPYVVSNLITSLGIVISGVVVPISQSPQWIKVASLSLPFARTIEVSQKPAFVRELYLDLLIALAWLIIGISAFNFQVRRMRVDGRHWL